MKVFNVVLKIVAALAVVAGIVYVVAKYGDKIVSWARGVFDWCKSKCCCCCGSDECCCEPSDTEAEALTEEEAALQADEADFEG